MLCPPAAERLWSRVDVASSDCGNDVRRQVCVAILFAASARICDAVASYAEPFDVEAIFVTLVMMGLDP